MSLFTCDECGVQTRATVGPVEHKRTCSVGRIERGALCPECSSTKGLEPNNDSSAFCCTNCGTQWETTSHTARKYSEEP